jgi:tetrahydromethanopterin S-methyltransferase subunit G
MTVYKGETFSKDVEFKALDEERRVAIGGVMVPNKADLQGDWLEPELIEQFSDGFMQRLQSVDGEATPGVMHAVFPEDHVSLAENRVLEESREIGGKEFPAGSWIQGWKFEDDELWALVQDDVLSGYSIGATSVEWSDPMPQDELPDKVDVAADYPEDEPTWQILDGTVGEVSSVDIPAVPDAVMVAAKAGGTKSILDHVDGKNEFVAVMEDRGAGEDEAERLWHYLQRALEETDGKSAPAPSDSTLTRWGRSMWNTITGGDAGERGSKSAGAGGSADKESRTLSQSNRERLMAAHDAIEDALSSDVEFSGNRFTDNPMVDFDVAEFGGDKAAPTDKDAPGGDTPDDTTSMSDDSDIKEKLETLEQRLDDIEEKHSNDDSDKNADDTGDSALEEKLDSLEEKLDNLAEASGKSQQLDGGDSTESKTSKADVLGLPGGDN